MLALSCVPGHAPAQVAPSYGELLRRSLDNAPVLLEQAANLRAARGDARQTHAYPNPSVGVEVENLGARAMPGDASQRQTTMTLTQPFEIGGKRSARIALGEAGVVAANARSREVEVRFAAELANAYATGEAAQQRLTLADEDVARANEDLRAADALVKAGKEANLRVAQARASVSAAIAAREAAKADLTEALANLSALVGAAEPYTAIDTSILRVATPPVPAVGPSLEDSPSIVRAKAERDAVAAQVRVEQVRPVPDLGLSGGLRRFGGTNETAFVVGLSATIPLFDNNRGAVAAAQERRAAADQRLAAVRLEANAARLAALAQVTAADGRLKAAGDGEAAADEAYRLGRTGYDAGKTSLLELLTLRRALTDAKSLTIESRLAKVRALSALARADGRLAFGE